MADQELEAVLGASPVTLSSGKTVFISEWGFDDGVICSKLVMNALQIATGEKGADIDALDLVQASKADMFEVIARTCGTTVEEVNTWKFNDVLKVLVEIHDQLLVDPQGGGAVPLVIRLRARWGGLRPSDSASSSTPSSPQDTPSPTSEGSAQEAPSSSPGTQPAA